MPDLPLITDHENLHEGEYYFFGSVLVTCHIINNEKRFKGVYKSMDLYLSPAYRNLESFNVRGPVPEDQRSG